MIWFAAAAVVLAIILAAWWFQRQSQAAMARAGETLAKQAQDAFVVARQADAHTLGLEKTAIEGAIIGLKDQLARYEELVKTFEKDRDQKYGRLEGAIEDVVARADQLGQTTSGLAAVLGNARVRGQWGQKMAEDILTACGLQENIQFVKEREIAAGRPDYTFLLPENHKLFMDVKFPLDHYLEYTQTEGADQQRAKEQFIRDVREHLRTMERRDYVAHEDGSLDYIVIFIPNEQVYGAINEWVPGLIDECLRKRTILCGPWTLYAILRIVWQAWQNYNYSMAMRDIIKSINGFLQDYGKFKERFADLGERLAKATEKYQEITTMSYKRLDQRLSQIEGYRKGHQIPEDASDPEALPPPAPRIPALTQGDDA